MSYNNNRGMYYNNQPRSAYHNNSRDRINYNNRNKRKFDHNEGNSSNTNQYQPDTQKYCQNLTPEVLKNENEWLERIADNNRPLYEQIRLIVLAVEAHPSFSYNIKQICSQLTDILKKCYTDIGINVKPFGSSVTNLALKGSDVDIFIEFETLPEPVEDLMRTLKKLIIKAKPNPFKKILMIPAKVPIIRCTHYTKISCDISFLNSLGVWNSELIKFLIYTNQSIRPFIMILKFWMKRHDLVGANFITSYALVMMAIFYLQQLEKPMLPSVHFLQRSCTNKRIIGDWDTSFDTDRSLLPPAETNLSVVELLGGFFEYYSSFDFGLFVISPFLGKVLVKTLFLQPSLLPPEFSLYKENIEKQPDNKFQIDRHMCVQDPFNHSHNLTRNMVKNVYFKFQDACTKAALTCKENEAGLELFKKLLLPETESNKKQKKDKIMMIRLGKNLVFDGSVELDENVLRNKWFDKVFDSVSEILTKIVKCEVEVNSAVETSETEKESQRQKVKILNCKLDYKISFGKIRNEARGKLDLPKNMTVVEKEEKISDFMYEEIADKTEKLGLHFFINCFVKKQPTQVLLEFNTLETKDAAKRHLIFDVYNVLQNWLPKWIESSFEC